MATYIQIGSTVTVGAGGAANIDFSSIPSTYTDLVLKVSARTSDSNVGQVVNIAFNGSSASITARLLYGNGAAAISSTSTSNGLWTSGNSATASTFGNAELYFPNYAGSTNKSWSSDSVTETNGTTAYTILLAGLWSNTAAINQITLTPGASANFAQYSTASLYGISKS